MGAPLYSSSIDVGRRDRFILFDLNGAAHSGCGGIAIGDFVLPWLEPW